HPASCGICRSANFLQLSWIQKTTNIIQLKCIHLITNIILREAKTMGRKTEIIGKILAAFR
ncbi:MAG TPA: hypothetical protein VFI06_16320, partial [Chitinophagaceae bacterium]|nr:hypothetical protein [Chitinophagaceae bacterium]